MSRRDLFSSYPSPKSRRPARRSKSRPGSVGFDAAAVQLDHINLWLIDEEGEMRAGQSSIPESATPRRGPVGKDPRERAREARVLYALPSRPRRQCRMALRALRRGVWTTQGEYLTAHACALRAPGIRRRGARGVPQERPRRGAPRACAARATAMRPGAGLSALVPPHHRGDEITIGKHRWRAIVGHGHAPEHLSLYSKELNTVIAGDMLLSTISTNVSVWSIDPEGDPLRLFLDSDRALPRAARRRAGAALARQALPRAHRRVERARRAPSRSRSRS